MNIVPDQARRLPRPVRTERITFRVTPTERARIDLLAAEAGASVAEILRATLWRMAEDVRGRP